MTDIKYLINYHKFKRESLQFEPFDKVEPVAFDYYLIIQIIESLKLQT